MKKENIQIFGLIALFLGIIFVILFLGAAKDEVALSQEIFRGLLDGRQPVEKYIDWQNLNALGLDVGKTYTQLPSKQEKSDYRKEFFKNLSASFKSAGGNPDEFINWRVYKRSTFKAIVAADYIRKGKVILFTLSGYKNKKLTSMQWGG